MMGDQRRTFHPKDSLNSTFPNISSRSDRLKHAARGLEAIGFNASASMYHVDRQDSFDSQYQKAPEEKKPKKSFLKKLVGGGKDKQAKI